jgi:hypothetical protein
MTYPIFIKITNEDGNVMEVNIFSIAIVSTDFVVPNASLLIANGWYHTKHTAEEIKHKIRLVIAQDLLENEVLT